MNGSATQIVASGAARPGRLPAAGYSLIELMVALGIMAVGAMMIGTLLPSAMIENKESVSDTMGTIISENAIAICRTRLQQKHLADLGLLPGGGFTDVSSSISLADRAYPIPLSKLQEDAANGFDLELGSRWYNGEEDWKELPDPGSGQYYPSSNYGWLVAARLHETLPNFYEIVIVPYRKFSGTDRPGPESEHEIVFASVEIKSGAVVGDFDVGAPVIDGNGQVAYVVDSSGELEPSLGDGQALTLDYSKGDRSPAIGCYLVRTSLNP